MLAGLLAAGLTISPVCAAEADSGGSEAFSENVMADEGGDFSAETGSDEAFSEIAIPGAWEDSSAEAGLDEAMPADAMGDESGDGSAGAEEDQAFSDNAVTAEGGDTAVVTEEDQDFSDNAVIAEDGDTAAVTEEDQDFSDIAVTAEGSDTAAVTEEDQDFSDIAVTAEGSDIAAGTEEDQAFSDNAMTSEGGDTAAVTEEDQAFSDNAVTSEGGDSALETGADQAFFDNNDNNIYEDPDFLVEDGPFETEVSGEELADSAGNDEVPDLSSLPILPTDVSSASNGCILVGLHGVYVEDVTAALDRINEIRREACMEGVKNPDTGAPLTMADYVPIKWSHELEWIARIRAAESSLTMQHKRTNGSVCFDIVSPGGVSSYGEVLAWNWGNSVIAGINQWYGEKTDWVNNTGKETGHYTQMIDPTHTYVGVGTFLNSGARYYNTTAGQYSGASSMDESAVGFSGECIQMVEVGTGNLDSSAVMQGSVTCTAGESIPHILTTGITYEKGHSEGLILMDGVNWTSSDGNVVRISGDGTTEAVTCGQAVISAQVPEAGLGAQAGFTVDHVRTVMPAAEATCTETGLTEGLCCANCGEVFEPQQIIDKLPHNYSNWTVTLEPACTKAGKKEKVCGMCGGKLEEVIPATGHSLVNDPAEAPTCTEKGKTAGKHCSVCGAIVEAQEEIPATGHSWESFYTTDIPASYTAEGSESIHCSVCDEIREDSVREIPKLEKIPVSEIRMNLTEAELREDETVTLSAQALPDNAYNRNLIWASSDEEVAEVDSRGHVIGHKAGTAVITVTAEDGGGAEASCTITVKPPLVTITIDANGGKINSEYDDAGEGVVTGASSIIRKADKGSCVVISSRHLSNTNKSLILAGWSQKRGGEIVTGFNDIFTASSDCTLYAVWVPGRKTGSRKYGDLNGNDDLDSGDILVIRRYISALGDSEVREKHPDWIRAGDDFEAMDLDHNGFIEEADCMLIMQHIAARNNEETMAAHPDWTITETFDVYEEAISLSSANTVISGLTDRTYTGSGIVQTLKVVTDGVTLVQGTDYTAAYKNNINAGTATVTVTGKGDYTGSVSAAFKIAKAAQTITASNLSLTYAKTGTITASGNKGALTYKSSNTAVAVVDTAGKVTAKGAGTAAITITAAATSNYSAAAKTVTVTVAKAVQTITAKSAASSVAVGRTTTVSITGAKGTKSFKSSDTTIATVSSAGTVTARKVGTVRITATSASTSNYKAASKTVTVKVVPAATTSLTAANLATGIKLTWKKVTGANGYKVYRGSTLIKTIASGSTVTFTDTKANTNGARYVYKLVAKASTGDSTLSKTRGIYRVSRSAVTSVKNSASRKMTVKWGKNPKASGYQVQYSTSKTFAGGNKIVSAAGTSTVSKVIASLTRGKTYYVRVRAYKTVNNVKFFSAWSAAKSVKITK